ncbi:HAD family hydrolase [Kitasatospora aburaviensis]|uniref:HAD family hydrolase n=1 Tax=Kitasatospora aburaviensis TaxID=67265 RepID=A0ABW1F4X4_9ACTN
MPTPPPRPPSHEPAAVLLDSGGVLIRPIGGRWNPRADFEQTVLTRRPDITPGRFAAAIATGDRFLDSTPTTPDPDDYHRVLLHALGVEPDPHLLADLRRDVPAPTVLETYPDVAPTLEELRRRGVRIAVVSDAWPNLPRLHEELGIGHFFEAYAISAELGCNKPDPRMYHHAGAALGLAPAQCLFVDDDPRLVAAAIDLGYAGRVLCREPDAGDPPPTGVPAIASLTDLLDLLRPTPPRPAAGRPPGR